MPIRVQLSKTLAMIKFKSDEKLPKDCIIISCILLLYFNLFNIVTNCTYD